MWRTRAVIDLMLEEVAGLPARSEADPEEVLRRARRRARFVALLDLVALATLFALRDRSGIFLAGEGIETVFTLGALAVATHAGFRLAQASALTAVERLCADLRARDPEG